MYDICLLYTSDAADEEDSVDLGGRRIIKKKHFKGTSSRNIWFGNKNVYILKGLSHEK